MPEPVRTTFTVRPEAHKVHRCTRCGFAILEGQQATLVRFPDSVSALHAGICPPLRPAAPVPTRTVNRLEIP